MAWCHQATSHYLSQCWPRFMSPYGVTRPQWVNRFKGAEPSTGTVLSTKLKIFCGYKDINILVLIYPCRTWNIYSRAKLTMPCLLMPWRLTLSWHYIDNLILFISSWDEKFEQLPPFHCEGITVRCHYNMSTFFKIIILDTPYLAREGEVWGVCWLLKVWFTFCCCYRSTICNIMINRTAL